MSRDITHILRIMNDIGLNVTKVTIRRLCPVCGGTGCSECFDSDGFMPETDTKSDTLGL